MIQNSLANLLYENGSNTTLTCADTSGASIPCKDGFCRSVIDGNGFASLSSCMKFKDITPSYGLIAQKIKTSDLDTPGATITYTCNKPMCNSKETAKEVLSQLTAAGIIPEPTTTTTTITTTATETATETGTATATATATATITTTTTTMAANTTAPISGAVELLNNRKLILISFFVFLFSILNI